MTSDRAKIILVMGVTGTGKTSFINTASGLQLPVSHDLNSCTDDVIPTPPFDFGGHRVVLVDTPGFGHSSKRDLEVLRPIAKYLVEQKLRKGHISGVIYMHPFPENPRRIETAKHYFNVLSELCGAKMLDHVSVVINRWMGHHSGSDSQIEMDLRAVFEPVTTAGGFVVDEDHKYSRVGEILREILDKGPVVLQIQRELTEEKKHLCDTAAGTALSLRKEVTEGFWKKFWDMLFATFKMQL
ncbi:hypothetical protein BD410DRAFT_833057 [Rickenella mellea]|uniref:G domain-containing protein n=1 Tax=Rickenella mellea TaxID=50990 RepID=A0A4Y7PGP3_9AGAM|nr:hypothetical protein BD410DRAFT_833057 [Rickenella mellea]